VNGQAEIITAYPPEIDESRFEREVPALVDQARAVVIHDQAGLTVANEISVALAKTLREIESTFDPIIDDFHRGHKNALATKARFADPVKEAIRIVKNDRIGGYLAEQRRKEQEVREAIWKAEQEKIRLQQEAIRKVQEAERKAAEEKRRAGEEARRLAEEADAKAARARSEEGRRTAQEAADRIRREETVRATERDCLAKAEQERILNEAAAKEAEIVDSMPAPIEKAVAKGTSISDDWDFEVVNLDLVPRKFMMLDEVKTRKYAKAMKDDAEVSGIRFFPKIRTTQRVK